MGDEDVWPDLPGDDEIGTKPEVCTSIPITCPQPGAGGGDSEGSFGVYMHVPPQRSTTDFVLALPTAEAGEVAARHTWDRWLGGTEVGEAFLVAMPYATVGSLDDQDGHWETQALYYIDRIDPCYCDSNRVHLAGFGEGGTAAFDIARKHPERFTSLMAAPGRLPEDLVSDAQLADAYGHLPVYVGVGEFDPWRASVEQDVTRLRAAGVQVTFEVFPGEMRVPSAAFDASIFYEWWDAAGR